jgi:hypothetical protein
MRVAAKKGGSPNSGEFLPAGLIRAQRSGKPFDRAEPPKKLIYFFSKYVLRIWHGCFIAHKVTICAK